MNRRWLLLLFVLGLVPPLGAEPPAARPFRVMTYNVHSCKGRDGKIDPERIARVIASYKPDVVALQEVRVGRVEAKTVDRPQSLGQEPALPPVGEPPLAPPSVIAPRVAENTAPAAAPFVDQPAQIADALGMYHVFYPLLRKKREDYGIAILSRHPMTLVRAAALPKFSTGLFSEPRGAVWVEVQAEGGAVQVVTTHLGLNRTERLAQVDALLGKDWLGSERANGPFVLCGDMNARPGDTPYKRLAARAQDAPAAVHGANAPPTWPSSKAFFRIDHVFVPKAAKPLAATVPVTPLTRVSSDHLPLYVDLKLF